MELKGHQGPILSIDLSSQYLASSSGDGSLRIWSLENEGKILKTIEGIFDKTNDFATAECYGTPSFDRRGSLLAFAKGKSAIYVLDTSNWETKFKLTNQAITGDYSTCSFSSCGEYLAAGSTVGEISVWNVADKQPIKGQYAGDDLHMITSLAWNPKSNGELAFCDKDGQLSTVIVSSSKKGEEVEANDIYEGIDSHNDHDFENGDAGNDSDDADNENCVSLEKLKNQTLKIESDSDGESSVTSKKSVRTVSERYPVIKPFVVQPPFQPGSTPATLEHRFMIWNHVGQVLCHRGEENSIIAEFHDVTIHQSLHILNTLNHEMASLSTTSLALATKESPCRLVVIAFVSAGSKEWSTSMPDCEEIQAIAAGENFVAAATDAGIIRFFTTMGTQREVISVPGPVVALSASDNKLAVVYHTSNSCNKFSLMIVTLIGPTMMNRVIEVPLKPAAKLTWLGFSDMGSIITYDSTGRVTSYNIKRSLWYPICDLNEHVVGASDKFFIVSVSESEQKIRATLCRGTSYPLANPRPLVREIDYVIPLCYMETEKSKLEEELIRATTFSIDSYEKTVVEKGLKLFTSALNSELESRAYEIVELIGNKKLIELAARYASTKGRIHMSNKISKLLMDFEEKEKEKLEQLQVLERDEELFATAYDVETPKAAERNNQNSSTPVIAPKPMIFQKKLNPFKKSRASSDKITTTPTNSSLSHLTTKAIGFNQSSTNSDDENLSASGNRSVDTPRPGNFPTWFIANKSDLGTRNPNSSAAELMKIGRNMYKELTQKTKLPEDLSPDSDLSLNSSVMNKRKLCMNSEEGGVSKLAKYGFDED